MSAPSERSPLLRLAPSPDPLGRYSDSLETIARELREKGAMAVVVVDSAALEEIEHQFGVEPHRLCTEKLRALVLEACADGIEPNDLIVRGDPGVDEWLIFLFRPRSADEFYRTEVEGFVERLREHIAASGKRLLYPYKRNVVYLPVGSSVLIRNPGLREEREIHTTIERARADAALNAQIEERTLAKEFRDLVLVEDITVLYEPIVNITTREFVGYEALSRGPWDTDLHTPDALFHMAEKTGLVFELDCLCRRKALQGARGLTPGKLLFLNCLPTAIHDPAFQDEVLRQTLEKLRLRPSDVVFEISEKESINNFDIFREARDYYAGLGFQIALDDTGVAYGSLEAIMELSPDFIKVDLTLVRGIDTDPPRQELLRALNSVAASINATVIAEGIETSEELATIQSLGIVFGQGYLFGRSAPLRRSF